MTVTHWTSFIDEELFPNYFFLLTLEAKQMERVLIVCIPGKEARLFICLLTSPFSLICFLLVKGTSKITN